ncbi:MAG: ferrous iron transport protein B, partial [Candidatus Theseobacter exili]|nr:ferrous iron transport protein B [Candidatus Theseobacter exili]
IITRDYILHEHPDVVINIVDSTNLERNLYLTVQLVELGTQGVVALNMMDEAKAKGITLNLQVFEQLLNMPVVETIGNRCEGIDSLLDRLLEVTESNKFEGGKIQINYGQEIEEEITKIQKLIPTNGDETGKLPSRWIAIKLLENDQTIKDGVRKNNPDAKDILNQAEESSRHIEKIFNDDSEVLVADRRYGFVSGLLHEVHHQRTLDRVTSSDRIDKIMTNRVLGIPIFFAILWLMFQTTFTVGAFPAQWLSTGINILAGFISNILPDGLFQDLIVNGIIGGVGGVLVYLPNILILFFFISLFEDTGYLARVAFLMDRIMHLAGLHGKSFIPMIMGFGCNIPAIMAARTLENRSDRILTILINPLISCSARLPVYVLLAGAFFGAKAGSVIFSIYIFGIVLSVIMGRIFRKTIFRGESAPFVMELPPYRAPLVRSLLIHMWDKGFIFLKKIGGVILGASIIIWALAAFPRNINSQYDHKIEDLRDRYKSKIEHSATIEEKEELTAEKNRKIKRLVKLKDSDRIKNSYIGRIGRFAEPILLPLGINWKGGVALITGVAAKEIVVSTFGVLYQVDPEDREKNNSLQRQLRKDMTPLSALAFMLFTLIYIPCLGTLAVMYRELGGWKWTLFGLSYSLVLAWTVAFIVYQGGRLLGGF